MVALELFLGQVLHLQLGCDVYAAADASEHGAATGMNGVRTKGRIALVGREPEVVVDVDALHHQHPPLELHLAHRF